MSAERCPECGAVGVDCGCAPGAGFEPLRIRPYVTLPDPGQSDDPPPPHPVRGVVAGPAGGYARPPEAPPGDDTPAYGTPVAWPDTPPKALWPSEAVQLRAATAATGTRGGGRGGGGGPEKRTGPSRRRRLPTVLAGAGTVVAVGTVALALGMLPRSGDSDTVLLDAKPSAPAVSLAPAGPTQPVPTSASRSASLSPSASKSASPSASPTASRSSAPSSPTRPTGTSSKPRTQAPPPPAQTLRYGDSGPEVEKMQRLLAGQGYYRGRINGKFDDRTERAVSEFQWQNYIDEEWGVYGPETRRALEGTG
ncbi:peptidoglycan-binding domain-containing protein [Streptomyces katrae]|uniref:peptidoglycan-binding domain-containing protein n=1 Tax=Streptomyces katrae TaxID=68223 RepID=UPI00131AD1D2|nr:peptidoglycan-binding domain-containing protein [Streptomyces katrae]